MFSRKRKKEPFQDTARRLYNEINRQSRNPEFYKHYGVPDTFDGRYELLVLHAYLIWSRLSDEGERGQTLAQHLFDTIFINMEDSLRAIGVGDMGVPKHIKRMMKGFKGRSLAYRGALDKEGNDRDRALHDALRRNLYGTVENPDDGHIEFFARYIETSNGKLAGMDFEDLVKGQISWAVQ